jgi:hypothetical protein
MRVFACRLNTAARLGKTEALAASAAAAATNQADGTSGSAAAASSTPLSGAALKQLAATPLTARLSNYDAAVYGDGKAPKLVEFPPPIEGVACKPVLFDLALNKAHYPDLTARSHKKKAGIMSWFGRK